MRSLVEKLNRIGQDVSDGVKEEKLKQILQEASNQTYYELMGMTSGETIDVNQVKKTYRKLAVLLHPDKSEGKPYKNISTQLFQLTNTAYETLSDPVKERDYRSGLQQENRTRQQPYQQQYTNRAHSATSSQQQYPFNRFGETFFNFNATNFSTFPNADFNPFDSASNTFDPESFFVFFSGPSFNGFPNGRYTFRSTPSSANTYQSPPPRSSARQTLSIENFDDFLWLLEFHTVNAVRLYNQQPREVIGLCQTAEQFLQLHQKSRNLAHSFYNEAPSYVTGLFQSSGQFIHLLSECNELAVHAYSDQPDHFIALFKTPEQYLELLNQDKSMAYKFFNQQPATIINNLQSYESYFALLKADQALALNALKIHPIKVIGFISSLDQLEQLNRENDNIVPFMMGIEPNIVERLSPSVHPESRQNPPSPQHRHRQQPTQSNGFFHHRQTDTRNNNTPQEATSNSSLWSILNNIRNVAADGLTILVGAVAALTILRLAQRGQEARSSHRFNP